MASTDQRPSTDVVILFTGMIMGTTDPYDVLFGYSTSGLIIPDQPLLYDRYLPPVISQAFSSTESIESPTFGNITLENDGRLNYLLDYSFGDRPIDIYLINDEDWDTKIQIFSGYIDQLVVGWQISITVKDVLSLLDAAAVNGTFLGNNILPDGIEGDEDLKGQTKPRLFGASFNISPTLVNTAKLIYGINWTQDGDTAPLYEITEVRDQGVILPVESDVADSSILQTTTPSAGYVVTCLAEGMFRLGSEPAGNVTADAQSFDDSYIGNVVYQMALEAGISADLLVSLPTAETNITCTVGIYAESGSSYRDIINLILLPLDLFLWADQFNKLAITRRGIQSDDEEKLYLIEHRTDPMPDDHIPIISSGVVGQTYPVYRLLFNYCQNLTVQSPDELAWESRSRWGKFAYQWSTHEENRQYVKDVFQEARQETRDTAIQCPCPAAPGAQLILDRLQYPHQKVRVSLPLLNKSVKPLSELIDQTWYVTMDSTVTTVDSTLVSMDRISEFFVYTPASNAILLGDIVGLRSPYVPDSYHTRYQVVEVETNVASNELNLMLEGPSGSAVFRGITQPYVIPENFCYQIPPPLLSASEYLTVDLPEPHLYSDWQIATDNYFFSLVDQSWEDPVNLTSWQPTVTLDAQRMYFVRVRYRSLTYRSRWSDPFILILKYRVAQPVITSPTESQTLITPDDMPVTITANAFAGLVPGLTHASSDWRFSRTGVMEAGLVITEDTVNLTSYTTDFSPGDVYIQVRYRADTGCLSEWSEIRRITVETATVGGGGPSESSAFNTPTETLPLDQEELTSEP